MLNVLIKNLVKLQCKQARTSTVRAVGVDETGPLRDVLRHRHADRPNLIASAAGIRGVCGGRIEAQ